MAAGSKQVLATSSPWFYISTDPIMQVLFSRSNAVEPLSIVDTLGKSV